MKAEARSAKAGSYPQFTKRTELRLGKPAM
jgi:hypothetical protein